MLDISSCKKGELERKTRTSTQNKVRKYLHKTLLLLLGLSCLGLIVFWSKPANAANPQMINFQGIVVNSDGTNISNGTYSFNFVLFDDATIGSESDGLHDKWHELNKSV